MTLAGAGVLSLQVAGRRCIHTTMSHPQGITRSSADTHVVSLVFHDVLGALTGGFVDVVV